MINFGIIGAGWRAEFYLRIAKLLPETFNVCGIYIRNPSKRKGIEEKYGVKVCNSLTSLLKCSPDFVVCSVYYGNMCEVTAKLCDMGVAVLSETPIGTNNRSLNSFEQKIKKDWKVQVAEQYHLQPYFQAVKSIIDSGILGEINQVHLSCCHNYHAASLIRFLLDKKDTLPKVKTVTLPDSLYRNNSRTGIIEPIRIDSTQKLAFLDYGDKTAIYDFNKEQYFSDIRQSIICIKGTNGEILNDSCYYLDEGIVKSFELQRDFKGSAGNIDGFYLNAYLGNGEILYKNPLPKARLSDEEIAVATCLLKMDEYLKTGKDFYSLESAMLDTKTALLWGM